MKILSATMYTWEIMCKSMEKKDSYLIFDFMKRMKSSHGFHSLFALAMRWRVSHTKSIAHPPHSNKNNKKFSSYTFGCSYHPATQYRAWSAKTKHERTQPVKRITKKKMKMKMIRIRWKNDIMSSRKKMENIFLAFLFRRWHLRRQSFCSFLTFNSLGIVESNIIIK